MTKTIACHLRSDPRVLEGKRLMLEAVRDYQRRITGIKPPDPELKQSYEQLIAIFGDIRAGALFYPYLASGIGKGPLVELADGSVKYDFISGIGVHHWGHSHPDLIAACLDAALCDTVMQGNLQQADHCVEFARVLLHTANARGAHLRHCFFSSSGAMANENALKLVFHSKPSANRILAFDGAFAGRTLVLSQITDRATYRPGLPHTVCVDYVPFFDPNRAAVSTEIAVEQLKRHLNRYPGKHAAMIFELVQGEGGFYPGNSTFFSALMEVLKKHGIWIIVDEIQTFGRTQEPFAFQLYQLDPFVDVVTVGKLTHVCATLFKAELAPPPGLLSQTYTASTSAFFAGLTIINELLRGGYFGPDGVIARLHRHTVRRLSEIQERHPGLISGPYGIGAMIAFTPFGGDPVRTKRFVHELFEAGVVAFYAGSNLERVRFLLPVGAVTTDHIDEVTGIVEKVLVHIAQLGS